MKKHTFFILTCLFIYASSFGQETKKATKTAIKKVEVFNGAGVDVYNLKKLHPEKVVVSSTLAHKNDLYDKKHLIDGNKNTAWVEGRDGDGKGDNISFFFKYSEGSIPPDVIAITPGYNKDDATWYKNNRVSKITIRMYQNEESADGDGLIDVIEVDLEKEDGKITPGKQYIDLSNLYLQNMAYTEFEILEITITEVDNENAKYDDTCISEVEFWITDELLESKKQ